MSSLRVRHATPEDAHAALEIVRALDAELIGESTRTRADLDDEWRKLDPERDIFVVVDGGEVVGYGTADDHGDAHADGYVHPAHFGRGAGRLLIDALEDELRARGADVVSTATLAADTRAHELLRSRGYEEVRRFSTMRLVLEEEPPAPRWPDGVEVTGFHPSEGEEFHAAYEDAFADHWGHVRREFEPWRRDHMEGEKFAPELWRVVRADGRIVAGLMGIWELDGTAHVSRLFTIAMWRRRGLGEALLHDAFGTFWRAGKRTVGLGVDSTSNTGAHRLYEKVGMYVKWGAVVFEKRFDA